MSPSSLTLLSDDLGLRTANNLKRPLASAESANIGKGTGQMQSRQVRLAHRWILIRDSGVSGSLLREFIRPAVGAVPSSMARRLGPCRISLPEEADADVSSRWTTSPGSLEISIPTGGFEAHDIAMELLVCLGQALWDRLSATELRVYWTILWDEINSGIPGEIDEQALDEKRFLFENPSRANSPRRLESYAAASFAGTAAEYVHCLWHDVAIRIGTNYLPAEPLRRRLQLIARWFPPDRGYRLFPPVRGRSALPSS